MHLIRRDDTSYDALQTLYPSDHDGYNVLDEFNSFHTIHYRHI
jgi:hypothetical protein